MKTAEINGMIYRVEAFPPCPVQIGDKVTVTSLLYDGTVKRNYDRHNTEKKTYPGTVTYINERGRFYRAQYFTDSGLELHDCTKF